jgi:hypothetical protein
VAQGCHLSTGTARSGWNRTNVGSESVLGCFKARQGRPFLERVLRQRPPTPEPDVVQTQDLRRRSLEAWPGARERRSPISVGITLSHLAPMPLTPRLGGAPPSGPAKPSGFFAISSSCIARACLLAPGEHGNLGRTPKVPGRRSTAAMWLRSVAQPGRSNPSVRNVRAARSRECEAGVRAF